MYLLLDSVWRYYVETLLYTLNLRRKLLGIYSSMLLNFPLHVPILIKPLLRCVITISTSLLPSRYSWNAPIRLEPTSETLYVFSIGFCFNFTLEPIHTKPLLWCVITISTSLLPSLLHPIHLEPTSETISTYYWILFSFTPQPRRTKPLRWCIVNISTPVTSARVTPERLLALNVYCSLFIYCCSIPFSSTLLAWFIRRLLT